jgi:tetratricopeptide (TPR) repeat protein
VAAAPPEPPPVTVAPLRAVVPRQTREASIEHYELCNLAIKNKQLDAALAECRVAVEGWAGNHLAWYALGNILALRGDWAAAAEAYDHAVQLRPDAAMYQTYDGVALYEASARTRDRDRRAALRELRDGGTGVLRVHRVARALASLEPFASAQVERARHALAAAVKLAPGLPLAHYYLGRIYRDQDYPAEAARELTAAIQQDASLAEPYISLVELYRVWAFVPESIAVARVGAVNVGGGPAADVWYELGMAQQANGQDADALSAFTRTLAIRPGHLQAKFQRGQVYLRKGELASAQRDLEDFVAAAGPELEFPREIATSLLSDLRKRLVTQKDPSPY